MRALASKHSDMSGSVVRLSMVTWPMVRRHSTKSGPSSASGEEHAPPGSPARVPDDRAWKDLKQTLKLDKKTSKALRDVVTRIVDVIEEVERRMAEQPDKTKRLRELQGHARAFDALTAAMRSPLFQTLSMRMALVEQVAPLISMEGYRRLVDVHSKWCVDPIEVEQPTRPRCPSDYVDALAIEDATRTKRMTMAHSSGLAVFERLLSELRAPLDRLIRVETQNRGGRPRNFRRDVVIAELARVMPNATGSPAGNFVSLCEAVLMAIGLDAEGIDHAVQRFLERRRKPKPGSGRRFLVLDPASGVPIAEIPPSADPPTVIRGGILVPLDDPEA